MQKLKGFWSYVHDDDKADSGRIVQLAKDIVSQYEMITGDKIELFLDKENIKWGENWKEQVDRSLASTAFFIPVVTPRYLMSTQCRREMQYFLTKAKSLGIKEIILTLIYVDVPQLNDSKNDDELIKIIQTFQYENWKDIRFKSIKSEKYRRSVSNLANRLVEANHKIEQIGIKNSETTEDIIQLIITDTPGFLDSMAKMETTIPEWSKTLTEFTEEMKIMGSILNEETISTSASMSFNDKLNRMKQLSERLNEPIENILKLSNKNITQLYDVDIGVRLIIEKAPDEIKQNPENEKELRGFIDSIKILINASKESFFSLDKMIKSIVPLEEISREIRPVMRKLRQALTIYMQSKDSFDEWGKLIDKLEKRLLKK
jgi:hypothetical protein